MLLKPWRRLEDLKLESQTWTEAFESFLDTSSTYMKRMVSSIEYFHQCRDAAKETQSVGISENNNEMDNASLITNATPPHKPTIVLHSEPEMSPQQIEEDWHGRMAIEIGHLLGIFQDEESVWPLNGEYLTSCATPDDYCRLVIWRKQLESDVHERNNAAAAVPGNATLDSSEGSAQSRIDPSVAILQVNKVTLPNADTFARGVRCARTGKEGKGLRVRRRVACIC
jgi:hypothetical protein